MLQQRLAEARRNCLSRMRESADWLEAADLADRDALRQCGHRLAGTLGSFGFAEAASLARSLESVCDGSDDQVEQQRTALVAELRGLA